MSAPVVGLHMIIRDEAETIEACLRSVLPHVDRALLLDTGSTDDTLAIIGRVAPDLCEHVEVIEAEWPGHFGKARQMALDAMLAKWPETTHTMWLDGDDVLVGGQGMRSLAEQVAAPCGGLLEHYAYAHDPAGNLACSHFRERLVAVEAIAGWQGAVHEVLTLRPGYQLLPAVAPADSQLPAGSVWPRGEGGIEVIHTRGPGKDTTGRNRVILEAEAKAARDAGREPEPRTLFYLSQEYAIHGALEHDRLKDDDPEAAHAALTENLTAAIEALDAHAASSGWDEETYQGIHRGADYLRTMGRHDEALARDLRAISLLPDWPDAWHGAAESYLALGKPSAALAYVDAGLSKPYPQTMLILNPLDYTVGAWTTRALALQALGRTSEAVAEITRAAEQAPHDRTIAGYQAAFSEAVNRERTRDALLALDESLARHDENLAAARLLEECVPYFLRDDPQIAERRRRRRAGVRHVRNERDRYQDYYGEDNEFIPIMRATRTDDPRAAVEFLCIEHALPRAQFLAAGLREQARAKNGGLAYMTTPVGEPERSEDDLSGLSVLDLGCNDGWLGWWLTAYEGLGSYHGFDLNDRAIDAAIAYGEFFPEARGRAQFTLGDIFDQHAGDADAVVSFEVIEHVPDAGAFLDSLASLCKPGGRVYVSTPNGAFERGNIADWDVSSPRGHVRAMRARELSGLMLDRGRLEGFAETRDGLLVGCFTPAPRKGTLDFYLGPAASTWSPLDGATKGLGGSETMAARMATRLADRGWRVRLYGQVETAAIQGVEYLPHYLFDPADHRDVLIGSRCPSLIAEQPNARHRVLWLHDADYPDLAEHAPKWDEVWTVGAWQAENMVGLDDATVRITRNAIIPERFANCSRGFEEREPWAVYCSSPDRGLVTLLGLWPEVYERCEAAGVTPQLHIAYGFTSTYDYMQQHSPQLAQTRREVEAAMSMPGVVWRGSMGQVDLAELQQRSRVWAYPTDFPEVSCITAMEAQAAGMACHATDTAELARTLGAPHVQFPPAAEWSDAQRAEYVHGLIDYLTDETLWTQAHEASLAGAARFAVDPLADEWDELLEAAIGRTTNRAMRAAA